MGDWRYPEFGGELVSRPAPCIAKFSKPLVQWSLSRRLQLLRRTTHDSPTAMLTYHLICEQTRRRKRSAIAFRVGQTRYLPSPSPYLCRACRAAGRPQSRLNVIPSAHQAGLVFAAGAGHDYPSVAAGGIGVSIAAFDRAETSTASRARCSPPRPCGGAPVQPPLSPGDHRSRRQPTWRYRAEPGCRSYGVRLSRVMLPRSSPGD
jgi:hypothetical protein